MCQRAQHQQHLRQLFSYSFKRRLNNLRHENPKSEWENQLFYLFGVRSYIEPEQGWIFCFFFKWFLYLRFRFHEFHESDHVQQFGDFSVNAFFFVCVFSCCFFCCRVSTHKIAWVNAYGRAQSIYRQSNYKMAIWWLQGRIVFSMQRRTHQLANIHWELSWNRCVASERYERVVE